VTASVQNESESPAAPPGAAAAWHALKFNRITVTHRQFFAGAYLPAAEEEQVVANAAPLEIGIARVVDELGAASPSATVYDPPGIHAHKVTVLVGAYPTSLFAIETPAHIFDDPAASRNVFDRKYSIPMKMRAPDSDIVIGRLRADVERLRDRRLHFAPSRNEPATLSSATLGLLKISFITISGSVFSILFAFLRPVDFYTAVGSLLTSRAFLGIAFMGGQMLIGKLGARCPVESGQPRVVVSIECMACSWTAAKCCILCP